VSAKIKVDGQSQSDIEFSLVWNMPNVSFSTSSTKTERVVYKRFYTRFFPETNPDSIKNLACYSLSKRNEWQTKIDNWQRPIFEDK